MAFRKRVFARSRSRSRTPFPKRSRFTRRRTTARKSRQYGGRTGFASGISYRSRRMKPRAWRSLLWRETQSKPHFRSVFETATSVTNSTDTGTAELNSLTALEQNFWKTSAGLQTLDTGVTPPTDFAGDIVIRGGKLGVSFYNANAAPVEINLWLIKQGDAAFGTPPSTGPYGWDPSLIPDFKRDYGTIIFHRKKIILENDMATFEYRLPTIKIDQDQHNNVGTWRWFISSWDPTSSALVTTVNRYFNLSFTGDAYAPNV